MYIKIFVLLALIFMGCSASDIPKDSKSKTNYSIIFYDTLNNKLWEGAMTLNKNIPGVISGEIIINKKHVNIFKGSDLINGKFSGSMINETTQLVLPPKVTDYNVYINLKRSSDGFLGNWTFTTMKGNENSGKVVCKKI